MASGAPPMSNARILVLGSLNADLVQRVPRLPAIGETLTGENLQIFSGGKGANQACAGASLGGRVAMAGKVGSDGFARQLLDDLNNAGADTSGVEASTHPTGTATILVLPDGSNCIMLSPGANQHVSTGFAERAAGTLTKNDFLLCQLETPLPSVEAALRTATANGATTVLDPAPAAPLPPGLLKHVHILTPNQVEATALLEIDQELTSLSAALEIARQLQKLGPPIVIVKMGTLGCAVLHGVDTFTVDAHRVKTVDTTAAGDTFNGALAVALSEGSPLRTAVAFANAAAALSVTRHGAMPSMPKRHEVDALLTQPQKSLQSQP